MPILLNTFLEFCCLTSFLLVIQVFLNSSSWRGLHPFSAFYSAAGESAAPQARDPRSCAHLARAAWPPWRARHSATGPGTATSAGPAAQPVAGYEWHQPEPGRINLPVPGCLRHGMGTTVTVTYARAPGLPARPRPTGGQGRPAGQGPDPDSDGDLARPRPAAWGRLPVQRLPLPPSPVGASAAFLFLRFRLTLRFRQNYDSRLAGDPGTILLTTTAANVQSRAGTASQVIAA